ncbi:MAG: CHAD domain-containing protein [Saprospiraceae bacterium]|nr:CHAD domain-containing protein [Saprospiraceae bacterium]
MKAPTKYLHNREAAIHFILAKQRHKYTSKTFHKLRIEIKKLNALLDLINFCAQDFKQKKTLKPFKQIFHKAGKVREIQLEEVILKKYCINNSLKDFRRNLKKLRLKEQKYFFSILHKNFSARLKKKYHVIASFLSSISKKKVNSYLDIQQNSITKLLSQTSVQTQHIHELRKQLKKFYNIVNCTDVKKNESMSNKKILPTLLGKWHDCQVILYHLDKTIESGEINHEEISQLEKIKRKISSDKLILLHKIRIALPKSAF